MRESDLNTIMLFITRTGMYVGKVSEETIVAFIHGYEIGTEGKCKLTESISNLLSSKYGIKKMATGWNGQIREYAFKNKLNWVISFRKIVLEHFYSTQDFNIESEFKNALKSRIESKISQLNLDWVYSNFENWINEWAGFVDLSEEKFQVIWNENELKILTALDDEIHQIRNGKNQLTDRLLELRNEYEKITKTQQRV